MTDKRWERLWQLFHEALELPQDERERFLTSATGDDAELRAELTGLIAAHEDGSHDESIDRGIEALRKLDPDAMIGREIGPYRLTSVIGEGGMGVVYAAEQSAPIRRTVALKLIKLGMDSREVIARFDGERQALAMMNHRNIARVLDAGATSAGRPYFVMELIDGVPITEYCDAARLSTTERLNLFLAVCNGVQHAHQKGVIHRDLKPTNVLITEEDGVPTPKIIDFGIAKATAQTAAARTLFTRAGMFIGTPEYMSPEQAGMSAQDVDTRTDVYSLGILLYELLVGSVPLDPAELRAAGYDEICRRIREDEPSRPSMKLGTLQAAAGELARNRRTDSATLVRSLRGDLDWITMRALEKDPERRYASPSELGDDLRRHLGNEPVEAGPPSALYHIGKFARRHTSTVIAGSLVALSLVLGIAAATLGLLQAREAERVANEEARTSDEVTDFLTGLFRVAAPGAADAGSVTAREILDRGVARIRNDLAGEPAVQRRLMQEMGAVYAQLGLLDEAERLFREAREIRTGDADETAAAMTVAGLANVRYLQGEYGEAVDLYREAIALAESSQDEIDVLWLATAYGNLGSVYGTLSRHTEALTTLQTAREMLVSSGHDVSREYGRVLRNIGIAQWGAEDFEAARSSYTAALEVYDQVLEPGHPDVTYVVNSLAILNYNLGDYATARPMFERGLANLERTLGPQHRDTASMMNNLGLLLLEMGLPREAAPRIEESLRIREAALGPGHEEVATSLCNLARLRLAENRPQAARPAVERCLAIRVEKLGASHPYVAGAQAIRAEVLQELGETP
jgi:non-specific serine/threonine protein kinase/serine/threonine-protein kinase